MDDQHFDLGNSVLCINLVCGVLIVTHNFLALLVLIHYERLHTSSIYSYRVCQTAADLMVGVVMLLRFFMLLPQSRWLFHDSLQLGCVFIIFALYLLKTESLLCMVVISLDSFLHAVCPLWYFRNITDRFVNVAIAGTFIFSVITVFTPFGLCVSYCRQRKCYNIYTDLESYFKALAIIIIASSVTIIVFYLCIYIIKAMRMKTSRVRFKFQSVNLGSFPGSCVIRCFYRYPIFVYSVYFLCWLQFIVIFFLLYTVGVSHLAVELAVNISAFNSTSTFHIMLVSSPDFRMCVKRLLSFWKRCQRWEYDQDPEHAGKSSPASDSMSMTTEENGFGGYKVCLDIFDALSILPEEQEVSVDEIPKPKTDHSHVSAAPYIHPPILRRNDSQEDNASTVL